MTGPVKPPVGPAGSVPTPSVEARTPAGTDFRAQLDASREASASVASARPVAKAGELDSLVTAMREGRIDAAQAVETLVARALDSETARGLSPSARAALEQHLRTTLADDPAMSQLVRDLERAR